MFLSGYEEEFVLGDLSVYREFDTSHFISNARTALTGKVEVVRLDSKFNFYSTSLEKAINAFSNIIVDTDRMKEFLVNYNNYDKADLSFLSIREIGNLDVITIRPQYISQYTTMVGNVLDKAFKGEPIPDNMSGFIGGEYPLKVQKQVVKTTLPYGSPSKELIKIRHTNFVNPSQEYIKATVIPFVTNFTKMKNETLAEANSTLNAIKETELTVKTMLSVVEKKKAEGNYDKATLNNINRITYNSIRGILDVASFTTYMMIRKLNIVSGNIITCNELFTDISNIKNTMTESFTMDSVIPTDTSNLSDDFMNGDIGGFEDLANKIYEYHASIPNLNTDMLSNMGSDAINELEHDQRSFDSSKYKEAYKIFDSINGGLDTIAAASDEYLMVFDDIVGKAGFSMQLEDRYKNYIDGISDVTEYTSGVSQIGVMNPLLYSRILSEVKAFPSLISSIAELCKETKIKMEMLINRFSDNINGEFKDSESVNEIKLFLSGLTEQYKNLVNLVCGNFMGRLRKMGNILSEMEANNENQNVIPDTVSIDTSSNIDFSEGFMDSMFDTYEQETMDIIHKLEMEYYSEKMKMKNGIDVVFEAPDENGTTATPPQPSTNNATGNKQDTVNTNNSVTVQDNSQQNNTNQQNNQEQKPNVPDPVEKYNASADKFIGSVQKKRGNDKFIAQNKDEVLSRNYSNVSVSRIDANSNMTDESTIKTLDTVSRNIESLANNPGERQNIKTDEDLVNKVVANQIPNLNPKEDTKKQLNNFFRTGSVNDPVKATVSNGDLKTQVQNKVLPEAERFNQNANIIADKVRSIGNSLNKLLASCNLTPSSTSPNAQPVAASTWFPSITGYSIFSEADNASPDDINKGENSNTQKSDLEIYRKVDKLASNIVSAAENGRYSVNNDNIKEIQEVIPKAKGVADIKTQAEKNAENRNKVTQLPQQQPVQQQDMPIAASTDYEVISNGEKFTIEEYLDDLINDIF